MALRLVLSSQVVGARWLLRGVAIDAGLLMRGAVLELTSGKAHTGNGGIFNTCSKVWSGRIGIGRRVVNGSNCSWKVKRGKENRKRVLESPKSEKARRRAITYSSDSKSKLCSPWTGVGRWGEGEWLKAGPSSKAAPSSPWFNEAELP